MPESPWHQTPSNRRRFQRSPSVLNGSETFGVCNDPAPLRSLRAKGDTATFAEDGAALQAESTLVRFHGRCYRRSRATASRSDRDAPRPERPRGRQRLAHSLIHPRGEIPQSGIAGLPLKPLRSSAPSLRDVMALTPPFTIATGCFVFGAGLRVDDARTYLRLAEVRLQPLGSAIRQEICWRGPRMSHIDRP